MSTPDPLAQIIADIAKDGPWVVEVNPNDIREYRMGSSIDEKFAARLRDAGVEMGLDALADDVRYAGGNGLRHNHGTVWPACPACGTSAPDPNFPDPALIEKVKEEFG